MKENREIAIRVEALGKSYRIGHRGRGAQTFREMLSELVSKPFARATNTSELYWALDDINFEIRRGEAVGIIGRNGAGKSTLLKVLSRITEPTRGRVEMRGRVASLLEVGTGFHPELTGRENIFLNGAILGMTRSEIRLRFDEIVSFSGVERFLDTPVKRYSSGMYVRLAFAVAAHLDSEIVLVDEVLAVGDAEFQRRCLGKMDDIGRGGRTVLFVSHNIAAVATLCRSAMLLEQGKVRAIGSAGEITDMYMASVLAEDKPNRFNAQRRSGTGSVRVEDFQIYSGGKPGRLICGAGMTIALNYRAERQYQPIQFLVGIYDGMNTRVLFLDTGVVTGLPARLPTTGRLIGELSSEGSLFPGRYTVNVAACVNGEIVDHIQGAMVLDVEESDFFGTGKLPAGKPLFLLRQKWSVQERDVNMDQA